MYSNLSHLVHFFVYFLGNLTSLSLPDKVSTDVENFGELITNQRDHKINFFRSTIYENTLKMVN